MMAEDGGVFIPSSSFHKKGRHFSLTIKTGGVNGKMFNFQGKNLIRNKNGEYIELVEENDRLFDEEFKY